LPKREPANTAAPTASKPGTAPAEIAKSVPRTTANTTQSTAPAPPAPTAPASEKTSAPSAPGKSQASDTRSPPAPRLSSEARARQTVDILTKIGAAFEAYEKEKGVYPARAIF